MARLQAISRKRDDGSVDVWVSGWHVLFADGEEPIAAPLVGKDAPIPVEEGEVEGVKVGAIGERVGVGYGDWLVLLSAGKAEVISAKPERRPSANVHYRRSFG